MQKEKRLVPQLRFPEFEDKLEITTFGKVIQSTLYGPRFNANDYNENGNVKTIRGTDLNNDGEISYDQVPLALLDHKMVAIHKLEDGDIVMITTADCGAVGVFRRQEIDYLSSAYGVRIRLNELGNPFYFKYFFQTWLAKREINKYIRKATVANLPGSDILRIKLNLISISEQQKIATFLTAIDSRLQSLEKKKSLLEEYKKGVMQQIFKQELRFKPALSGAEVDEDGKDFPEWEKRKLGSLLFEVNEKSTVSNQHTILSSTTKGLFNQSDYFTRDIASKDNTGYKILRKYQLVFSPQNLWLGNININLDFDIGVVSPSYKIFDFNKKLTSYDFCRYLLFTNRMFYEYAQSSEQGASVVRRNLDMASFKAIPIKLPHLKEQTKIANFLSALDKKIELVSEQIEKTKDYKKGLLQQMFV